MTELHEPTPEFLEGLEDELTRAFRRNRPDPSRFRGVVIAVVCVILGAAGTLASGQVQDSRRRDALLQDAQAELELAKVRYDLAVSAYAQAKRMSELAVLSERSLGEADAERRAMELKLQRAQLTVAEIAASSQPARDDVGAPLVKGRDYVLERWQLDQAAAQNDMVAAERILADSERKMRMGVVGAEVVEESRAAALRARAALEAETSRIALRKEFVAGRATVAQATTRLHQHQLERDIAQAQAQLSLAQSRLARMRQMREAGLITELEVQRAALESLERAVELQKAKEQLELLKLRKEPEPS
jgi:hypothetical protein